MTLTCYIIPYLWYSLQNLLGWPYPELLCAGVPGLLRSMVLCVYRGADGRMADEGECEAEDIIVNKNVILNGVKNLYAYSLMPSDPSLGSG